MIGKGTRGLGNMRKNEDHPVCNITEIGQNTENSHGDLEDNCCLSDSSRKHSANPGVKNSQRNNNMLQTTVKRVPD